MIRGLRTIWPWLDRRLHATETFGPTTVPKGSLWVMGDNRGNSRDSRFIGAIKESDVIGRAILKVWPIGSQSFL